ncbi:hypothetical protein ANCDUO_18417 [Ancylostoma duodenale]|uniref:Uncharacterized protein n=1 Tax=Ancylostoma duodenale TaxID=51022 RepID=A0A0C2G360_9BILA|nr:hypothetical protein ANCDUO_18417 [Ancylostoma duodenale]
MPRRLNPSSNSRTAPTDFICNTRAIKKHSKIEGHSVERSYDEALQVVRQEIESQAVRDRPTKTGPIGYATVEGANPMEGDGIGGKVLTKVVLTFDRLLDVLKEWSTFKTWVLVWPLDMNVKSDVPKKLLTLSKKYPEEGGKIVTAWPLITSENQTKWHGISDLWKSFDEVLVKCDCGGQVVTAGSNM